MQPLLDAPAAGPRLRARALGAGAGRSTRRRDTEPGTAHGSRRERADARARRRRRRSRRSPTTRSCRTATRARSSRPTASVDWLCVPRFDSPSVFGSLLDREAGSFRLRAVRHQRPDLARTTSRARTCSSTTWKTPTGWVVVRDALTIGPRRGDGRRDHAAHAPAGRRGRRAHARADGRVPRRARRDRARLRAGVRLRARAGRLDDRRRASGHAADATGAGVTLRLRTDLRVGIEGGRVRARHVLQPGEAVLLRAVLGRAASPGPATPTTPTARMEATTRFWRSWLAGARIPDHRWREPIQRSALAIKGLTYMPTGATVAALTTSLPETPGGERNWDYRYTWMRDTTFTLQALHWLEPGLGGRRVHAVRRRPGAERRRRRCRSCTASTGAAT